MSSALHTLKNNLAAEVMVVAFGAKYGDFKAGQTVDTVNENVSLKKLMINGLKINLYSFIKNRLNLS